MSNSFKRVLNETILGPVSIGLILGLLYGLVASISQVISHDYAHYRLYNLGLLDFQSNITKYTIIFSIIAFAGYLVLRLVSRLTDLKFLNSMFTDTKRTRFFVFFIQLSFLFALVSLVFYSDILTYLKILSLDNFFNSISSNPINTFRVLFGIFIFGSLFLLILITYICSKLGLITFIDNRLQALLSSRQTRRAGIVAVSILILFNIFMFFYTNSIRGENPNIVLITIDTLRADRLSSYGYHRITSPNIDRLAEKGILFENAYSQSSWTYPSMASMHTSEYPSHFGDSKFKNRIHNKSLTLAEHMKNNFYSTYAVVSNIVVSEIFGFGQGFDKFEDAFSSDPAVATSKITTEKALRYIKQNKSNPFFVWIHYMDPHGHYIDHDEFDYSSTYKGHLPDKFGTVYLNNNKETLSADDLEYINRVYDEEISYTDKHIGDVMELLSDLEIDDNTIVILTADHGEELMDRDRFGHGTTLYQEVIRVPLIIYNPLEPKFSGKRVEKNVEVRFIAKTIEKISNTQSDFLDGYDLYNYDDSNFSDGIVYSAFTPQNKTIYLNEWKLITDKNQTLYELYNLKEDPLEQNNLFDSDVSDIVLLKEMLGSQLAKFKNVKRTEAEELTLGNEDIKKLKALGYLQ